MTEQLSDAVLAVTESERPEFNGADDARELHTEMIRLSAKAEVSLSDVFRLGVMLVESFPIDGEDAVRDQIPITRITPLHQPESAVLPGPILYGIEQSEGHEYLCRGVHSPTENHYTETYRLRGIDERFFIDGTMLANKDDEQADSSGRVTEHVLYRTPSLLFAGLLHSYIELAGI
jgi:hypothetical protein